MKYNDTLQCFKNMFHATQAHEWMNDAHVYEMQVQMWKPNTWGVTYYIQFVDTFPSSEYEQSYYKPNLVNNSESKLSLKVGFANIV